METETIATAELLADEVNFDGGIVPEATAWVKWNVKGGGDRTETPEIGHLYQLQGQPNIQGIEIKSSAPVILFAWSSPNGSGSPDLSLPGPTGQVKNNPVRIGSYRVDYR
ncbi:hypothetical protein J3F84DRAFT_368758 [Trichoderma pleuroticola]|uniref:Uncharacterized protein n=1 Tax=Trichoderma harzianum TaxID=5544 RepID=A0A2K0UMH1_TRIHA|nr:hypothetical protein THARTR1_01202 [Trichoderma harzianum]